MAHEAKVNLSGKYIGKYQLKIGFGKVHASNMVWIGGISSSVSGLWLFADECIQASIMYLLLALDTLFGVR